jgi:hypothetical protein
LRAFKRNIFIADQLQAAKNKIADQGV